MSDALRFPIHELMVERRCYQTASRCYIQLGKGSLFRCDFPPEMIVTEEHAADLSHSA